MRDYQGLQIGENGELQKRKRNKQKKDKEICTGKLKVENKTHL